MTSTPNWAMVSGSSTDGDMNTPRPSRPKAVMSPSVLEPETIAQFGVEVIGRSSELVEEFYAVSVERRITHPCVVAITDAARGRLFTA